MKRAQGISLNTIIIAAIALIVLIIVIAIFSGKIGGINVGFSSCENKGGTCLEPGQLDSDENCPDRMTEVKGVSSCENKGKCCMTVFRKEEEKNQ